MQEQRKALGRGLSSLIPMGNRSDSSSKNYLEIPPTDIIPNENQPRKLFNKTTLDELATSIQEKGILQPLLVRKLGGGKYELIAGERRYRAALQLHLEKVPVVIKDVESDETLELALIENIQRENLNPIEEALAYKELISRYQYTQDELAKRLGRDRSSITNILRLLKLPDEVRSLIIEGKISMGHARALIAIENKDLQIKLSLEIIARELSVRDIENLTKRLKDEEGNIEKPSLPHLKAVQNNPNHYFELEETLKKDLKTKVHVRPMGPDRGQLVLYFHSREELDRLCQYFQAK